MTILGYEEQITALFDLGEPSAATKKYCKKNLELFKTHIPGLTRMATDAGLIMAESEITDRQFAPLHAAYILGLLKAPDALESLMSLFFINSRIDNLQNYLPEILGEFGFDELADIFEYHLENFDEEFSIYGLDILAHTLYHFSRKKRFRNRVIKFFLKQLITFEDNSLNLNAIITKALTLLKSLDAIEQIPLLFATNEINENVFSKSQFVAILKNDLKDSPSLEDKDFLEEIIEEMAEGLPETHTRRMLDEVMPAKEIFYTFDCFDDTSFLQRIVMTALELRSDADQFVKMIHHLNELNKSPVLNLASISALEYAKNKSEEIGVFFFEATIKGAMDDLDGYEVGEARNISFEDNILVNSTVAVIYNVTMSDLPMAQSDWIFLTIIAHYRLIERLNGGKFYNDYEQYRDLISSFYEKYKEPTSEKKSKILSKFLKQITHKDGTETELTILDILATLIFTEVLVAFHELKGIGFEAENDFPEYFEYPDEK